MASATDYFSKAYQRLTTTLLADKALGATTASLNTATNFPTTTGIKVAIYNLDTNGDIDASTLCVYRCTVVGSSLTNLSLVEGTDRLHSAGATVSLLFTATHWNDAMDGILVSHNQDGTHAANLPLTTPQITTGLKDANGNTEIAFTATASAVNQITVANSATSTPPSITATGTDTNINLKLDGKGTGLVIPRVALAQGGVINGKFVTSVATNNLTLALKTSQGNDPSANDPVYVRIGDTVRTVTTALSVTKNAGTNWFNSGSAETATQEIDYFVYLGYNATDGVVIGFARIPYAIKYGDFSATTTNDKYCAISTITNAVSTDQYEVVGRFNATLSATAAFNWSIPATSIVISRPIFETRELTYTPTVTAGSGAFSSVSATGKYVVALNRVFINSSTTITTNNTAAVSIVNTLPLSLTSTSTYTGYGRADGVSGKQLQVKAGSTTTMSIFNYDGTYPGANSEVARITFIYGLL